MQAQVITEFGGTSVFKTQEIPTPKATPGHVVIEVKATSVNPVDTKIRSGSYAKISPDFPAILHGDFAGVVAEVGTGVTTFKVGDEVYGCAGGVKGANGALADYMLVDAKLIALKPKQLSMAEAAALPLVAITAWEGLYEKVKLTKDQKVLIHAGTGGVGHIAIQLAKCAGADVYATVSSAEKAQIAKSLGATDTINYRTESVEEYVKRLTNGHGFDVVFDTVGGDNLEKSLAAVAMYGNVISILSSGTHDLTSLHSKSASLHAVLMLLPMLFNVQRERHGEVLKRITELAEQCAIKPLLDPHQFTFADVGKAHDLLESGKAVGKIVLTR